MSDETIGTLPPVAAVGDDFIVPVYDPNTGITYGIPYGTFKGGNIRGGGTLYTDGFDVTAPGNGVIAMRDTANTWAGIQTFSQAIVTSAGINVSGTDIFNVFDVGNWDSTITIQGSSSNPTVAFTTKLSVYQRINSLVWFWFHLAISTISGGSGDARIVLPFTATAQRTIPCVAYADGPDFATTNPLTTVFNVSQGQAYGVFRVIEDNGATTALQISGLSNGDTLIAAGMMLV